MQSKQMGTFMLQVVVEKDTITGLMPNLRYSECWSTCMQRGKLLDAVPLLNTYRAETARTKRKKGEHYAIPTCHSPAPG